MRIARISALCTSHRLINVDSALTFLIDCVQQRPLNTLHCADNCFLGERKNKRKSERTKKKKKNTT